MLEKDYMERHRKARIYQGRLAELLSAAFIEDKGWRIDNLAALGGTFDIEATSPDIKSFSIEVKFIGQEDLRFQELVENMTFNKSVGNSCNIYDGYNYFLFRTYEAAKQLSDSNKNRIALLIISNLAWPFLSMPIKDEWIKNRPIAFSQDTSDEWKNFLIKKKKERKFANIDTDLDDMISQPKELWVMQEQNYLEYSRESVVRI
jgi:hypothetical protein